MLKNIILLILPLMLMSCEENNKLKIQDLLDKNDIVNAKALAEESVSEYPLDPYYNGAMSYVLSVECLSRNCVSEDKNDLKTIKSYLSKSNGLSKVGDAYFVDFYTKTMTNVLKAILKSENAEIAEDALRIFVNPTNSRYTYISDSLYSLAIQSALNDDRKELRIAIDLLNNIDFKFERKQKESIDLLNLFNNNTDITIIKESLSSFNKAFAGEKLPENFLMLMPSVLVNYSLDNGFDALDVIKKSTDSRSVVFQENLSSLRDAENIEYYSKGIDLLENSDKIIEKLTNTYAKEKSYIFRMLQGMSLKLNPNNKAVWHKYILESVKENPSLIYKNMSINDLDSSVIISNNDDLLDYANKNVEKMNIIPILNEIVFRDDANKQIYTNKTIAAVERALNVEIKNDDLDAIFDYLNYAPVVKSKFKDKLNIKLASYMNDYWAKNNFEDLSKLTVLYNELNDMNSSELLLDKYKDFLASEEAINFFKSDSVDTLVSNNQDEKIKDNMHLKFKYIANNVDSRDLEMMVISLARKSVGNYTQLKMFSFFSSIFTLNQKEDLFVDAATVSINKDKELDLEKSIKLLNFLNDNSNKLPVGYIENHVFAQIKSSQDIINIWNNANDSSKIKLSEYNKDLESFINVVKNDKANNKITASKYVSKITSAEIKPFVEKYNKIYTSYTDSVKGIYLKQSGAKGPEVIVVEPTNQLLKISIKFISRLGNIENLDKYKLDRGEVLSKSFVNFYNPISHTVKLNKDLSKKEQESFIKSAKISIDGDLLTLKGNKYKKVEGLFGLNQKYGIVSQTTAKTKSNFHILPEGSSFSVLRELAENKYLILLSHPAMAEPLEVEAEYNTDTLVFSFNYEYYIKMLDKTYSAKAKCQILNTNVVCAVQDEYWKREQYSVIVEGLQVN